ncbi:DR2241 family protein [Halosolutus halophilus]|uniref:DR2241 family protein n=1 Tax=Halosolutus halophilus TaxID=1552990 RepID=UPI00223503E4|nr:DR2241 family protein [Halosolutus halophilus]
MTVPTADVDDLQAAVETDGAIEFDGLRLARGEEGYALETPESDWSGLDEVELRDALVTVREYVTNWRYWQDSIGGDGTARRTFLRWCERAPLADEIDRLRADDQSSPAPDDYETLAVPQRYEILRDGFDREWGQLCVTTRLVDSHDVDERAGERVYDLWHVDDADTDLADLEVYDDPRDAREIATFDEDDRYRPLKTAPTLVSGWAFTGLSGDELVETIEFFYPATIANWHRELRGDLDVDHWLETAERQTGIYDVIDELPREAVDWMAEACCVDSQCLRRREWQYEAGDDLDVDGGDGPFPCREPCSLVVAAARKWTVLESEDERTYELELTTSELNQLTELIDAVAEGRTDEIREADVYDGANRYRARYLRAKRFADDGSLDAREVDE